MSSRPKSAPNTVQRRTQGISRYPGVKPFPFEFVTYTPSTRRVPTAENALKAQRPRRKMTNEGILLFFSMASPEILLSGLKSPFDKERKIAERIFFDKMKLINRIVK
jgi:hypothetical protein